MERSQIAVKSGTEYDHYFPKANGTTILKKKNATVSDTIQLIPAIIRETAWQTRRFAHGYIKGKTLEETCQRLWTFVFEHIAYKKDMSGKEQVRSPARTWRDRHTTQSDGSPGGVDCDCYSTFIGSVLYVLQIPFTLRITAYDHNDYYQHIYPIVPKPGGGYYTLDAVTYSFNHEVPYTKKYDTKMDLEYLNGVEDTSSSDLSGQSGSDYLQFMSEKEALSELGKLFKRNSGGGSSGGGGSRPGLFKNKPKLTLPKPKITLPKPKINLQKPKLFQKKTAEQKQERKQKLKTFLKKGLHVTNRLNPATVAVRAGVLAAMKLNTFHIASELRYTYLSDEQAAAKGIDMTRFPKMKNVRIKLEQLFFGAGGKPENLKQAILTGKANQDREIPLSGLYGYDAIYGFDPGHNYMPEPLSNLLGKEMYYDERMHEVQGLGTLGALGEPATAASLAAASSILTVIVSMIKQVGSIIPRRKTAQGKSQNANESSESGSANETSENATGSNTEQNNSGSSTESTTNQPSATESGSSESASTDTSSGSTTNDTTPGKSIKTKGTAGGSGSAGSTGSGETGSEGATNEESTGSGSKANATGMAGFWQTHKKWLKPVGIGIGTLGLIVLTYQLFKPKKQSLSGLPAPDGYTPKSKKKGGKRNSKKKYQPTSRKKRSIDLQ